MSPSSGELTNLDELQEIMTLFPSGINHAFGYGSGVFVQNTNPDSSDKPDENRMLDMIFSVDDPLLFHEENLKRNPTHYSAIPSVLGAGFTAWLQDLGPKVYFNPLIKADLSGKSVLIKYGIVSKTNLLEDLRNWDYLYLAGRLHKPTVIIKGDDSVIKAQEEQNLKYALCTSLLLLDSSKAIPLNTLFEKIVELSYIGDPRMSMGSEDPLKVKKLVYSSGQPERFYDLYRDQLEKLQRIGLLSLTKKKNEYFIEWDNESESKHELHKNLPPNLGQIPTTMLQNSISQIVSPAAKTQSLKGVFTAGLGKSITYLGAKLAKGALRKII